MLYHPKWAHSSLSFRYPKFYNGKCLSYWRNFMTSSNRKLKCNLPHVPHLKLRFSDKSDLNDLKIVCMESSMIFSCF